MCRSGGNVFHYACTRYRRHKSFNVFQFPPFSGTRLSPKQLATLLHRYTDSDEIGPPSVYDLAGDAQAGCTSVCHAAQILRKAQVGVAKQQNRRGHRCCDLEIDKGGIGLFMFRSTIQSSWHMIAPVCACSVEGKRLWLHVHAVLATEAPSSKRQAATNRPENHLGSRTLLRAESGSTVTDSDGAHIYKEVTQQEFKKLCNRAVSRKATRLIYRVRSGQFAFRPEHQEHWHSSNRFCMGHPGSWYSSRATDQERS